MKMPLLHRQHAFSIIELMVAMVISLLLLTGVAQLFLGNRDSYQLLEASSNVQENGRFGMQFLVRDIRMAGYMGCANTNSVTLTNNVDINSNTDDVNNTAGDFDGTNALIGYTYDGTFPADLTSLGLTAAEVVEGTDALFVQQAKGCPGSDVIDHNNTSAQYKISDNSVCNVQKNDIVLLSDCVNADIHGVTNNVTGSGQITIAHGANLNKTPKLANSYGTGSSLYKMTAMIYYIGFGASGEPALFRRRLVNDDLVNEELVEGIYDMDILYGEDTDGDGIANRYVTAADVTDWPDVVSVNTTLFTRSLQDGVTESTTAYTFDAQAVTDNRLQRDFGFTTTLRNRVK